jgi:triacylglycerol esterase/lipase EstA (alpha/beta hydrolase family)
MLLPTEDNKGETILRTQHLYVFAHGFQGNHNDLRGIKN